MNRPILYFFFMQGCGACDEAKPELDKFERAHPMIKVARIDISNVDWKSPVWQPSVTPTYGWLVPGKRLRVREGIHKSEELGRWIRS
jgi:thiol-disulfide isomerase/thioredoxin